MIETIYEILAELSVMTILLQGNIYWWLANVYWITFRAKEVLWTKKFHRKALSGLGLPTVFSKGPCNFLERRIIWQSTIFPLWHENKKHWNYPPFKISSSITISKISYTFSLSKSLFATLQNGCRENGHLVNLVNFHTEIQSV